MEAREEGPVEDEEIRQITLVRLGGTFPVDRGEGRIIPLWVIGHYDRDFRESGLSLSGWVKTSRQEATVKAPLGGGFRVGGELRGEILSAGDALFRYEDGEETGERAFEASTAGVGLLAEYDGSGGWRAGLRYRLRRYFFADGADTAGTFRLPAENTTQGARLELGFQRVRSYEMGELREGFAAGIFGEYERRDAWTSWGDERSTLRGYRDGQDYWRYGGHLRGYLRLFGHHGLGVECIARFGEDLDFLSEYTLGSELSAQKVVGYTYAEFRTRRLVLTNLRYGANLWDGARGALILDAASLRAGGKWKWITGVGASLRQKVWFGIPIVLQYGYGIDAKRGGGRGGHEIFLSVTAAY